MRLGDPRLRGLGLATATTSAILLPQFEQRIRIESAISVTDLPADPCERLGLDVARTQRARWRRPARPCRARGVFVLYGACVTYARRSRLYAPARHSPAEGWPP
jgi:hypothetical protein